MGQGYPAIVESPDGDIIIGQGKDNAYGYVWERDATPVPIEADGWILKAQIRPRPGGPVWLTLSSTADTEHGSGIGVNDSGEIVVFIDHRETEAEEWNAASRKNGVWDIEAFREDTDEKPRLVMGKVTLSPDVTRDS